jgi:SAM-dependent methyltransferase
MNVFSRIYRDNAWNGIETRSGPGSHLEPTRRVADAIVQLVDWLGVESVLDVGCGEGSWMPELPNYLGIDVAPEAIAAAEKNHPERLYIQSGAWVASNFDLVICRDVIQHLSLKDGQWTLESLRTTGSKCLLASTYIDGENVDIKTGDAYRPNLEAEPFNLPPALLLIHDGYEYHDGDRLRDPGKMLGLWRL